ncbi:MAG TPA: type II toxin-antitoxin system VapB family antitoxin [Nocardioidaceae bacterium]|nr:type II toxin-antitoxin system VapB family antitoxin [Nocardioidaceae bacterium]
MRTTVNIDDDLLAEAKMVAARTHRTIGSVLEDALRTMLDKQQSTRHAGRPYRLPTFEPANPGLRPGVDLYDKEQVAELLGDQEWPRPS